MRFWSFISQKEISSRKEVLVICYMSLSVPPMSPSFGHISAAFSSSSPNQLFSFAVKVKQGILLQKKSIYRLLSEAFFFEPGRRENIGSWTGDTDLEDLLGVVPFSWSLMLTCIYYLLHCLRVFV